MSESERIAFPISFRQRDKDLAFVFSQLEKGDRSEYARQLMRDGLRFRIQNGIAIETGSTEMLDLTTIGQAKHNPPMQTAIIIEESVQESDDNDSSEPPDIISDEVTDEELDELFVKQHMK